MKCNRCGLGKGRMVKGVGPVPARVMVIGEAPGYEEDKYGEPFVGKTGRELDYLLARNGIVRDDCFITNIVKCRPPDNRDPDRAEIEACRPHLDEEIIKVQPEFIILVGRVAAREFLGDVDMAHVHGLPYRCTRPSYSCVVIPVYHPAAGLHMPEMMIQVQADFEAAGAYITGKRAIHTPTDAYPVPDYGQTKDPHLYSDLVGYSTIAVDTEWARGKPWCLSYSQHPGEARVIMAEDEWGLGQLGKYLASPGTKTVIHNALYDLPVLAQMGIYPTNVYDTMVMAYLLCTEPQGLKTLAYRHLGMAMQDYLEVIAPATRRNALEYLQLIADREWEATPPIEIWQGAERKFKQPQNIRKKAVRIITDAIMKGADPWERWGNMDLEEGRGLAEAVLGKMLMGDLSDIPLEEAIRYAARDADATMRLFPILWDRTVSAGLEGVFHTEMGMLPMVVEMMGNGIKVDREHLQGLSSYFQSRMDVTRIGILAKLYHNFNISLDNLNPTSWQQVGSVVYDLMGLKGMGKRARATDAKTLATMLESGGLREEEKEVIEDIQTYRSYVKLKGTYADTLPVIADENSRVHTSFRTTRAATGRLTSAEPNLQNQPSRGDEAKKIKDGFIAEEGYVLVECDYSQIELRVLAHMSQDANMMGVFNDGLDLHAKTASDAFGIPVEQVEKWQRSAAKTLNFGIAYGMQSEGLQAALATMGIQRSAAECDDFIRRYFRVFPNVEKYMESVHEEAKRFGYVTDMFGRRRYIPHARSKDKRMQAQALREAGNFGIQSGAQGIIKKAMGELYTEMKRWNENTEEIRALTQVHDSILFEVGKGSVDVLVPKILGIMSGVVTLSVPTPVDAKVGERWGGMEKWKG